MLLEQYSNNLFSSFEHVYIYSMVLSAFTHKNTPQLVSLRAHFSLLNAVLMITLYWMCVATFVILHCLLSDYIVNMNFQLQPFIPICMQIFIQTSHGQQGMSENNYQFPIIIHRQIKLNCTAFMRLLMPLKWYYLPIIHIQYDELCSSLTPCQLMSSGHNMMMKSLYSFNKRK